ncbi:uncharacterized protein LY89DRAFT_670937 [Mollisia scopiformis]|uniref:F-box domain-containing protein n=1 Tax=Mollisia scopiformis TaxID=149040 RepID=A0A194X6P4_MOLSC|nr:uncharacterized protein LY89DRAFT_670937 [Mollisia scopiformis]KUJ15472.1 hypothetical protein LY89DRAFT_670937 [Mollisia scopiformis]
MTSNLHNQPHTDFTRQPPDDHTLPPATACIPRTHYSKSAFQTSSISCQTSWSLRQSLWRGAFNPDDDSPPKSLSSREMSSGHPPTTIPDESDTVFDLNTVFSHPAGLRVARYIVGTYIRAAQHSLPPPAAEDTTYSVPVPSFESSPEVASLLETILALSDSQVRPSEENDARLGEFAMEALPLCTHEEKRTDEIFFVSPDSSAFDRIQESFPSSSQQTPNNFFATTNTSHTSLSTNSSYATQHSFIFSNSFQLSLASHTQLDQASRSFVNSWPDLSSSFTSGSDSPYRIESPSRTSTNNTPQPRCSQSSGPSLPETNMFSEDDVFVSRLPRMRKSLSTDSTTSSSTRGNMGENTFRVAFSSGRGQPVSSTSPTIKSFMPVNKMPEGSLIVTKPSASGNSSFPARDMATGDLTTSTTSSQTSTPTPSSSSSSLNCTQRPFSTIMQAFEMEHTPSASSSHKRKAESADNSAVKKTEKGNIKRIVKLKEAKPKPAAHKLGPDLWMRILEFTPPPFIKKARSVSKDFKCWIDEYSSIFVNQRMENYGVEMPPASAIQVYLNFDDDNDEEEIEIPAVPATPGVPGGDNAERQVVKLIKKKQDITERQYNDLLGGKGCLEKEKVTMAGTKEPCSDEMACRTHWSWAKRWCSDCWKAKIEREDRILKARQNIVGRQTLQDLLACIPNGMHDSFMKPHDYVTEEESRERARGAPRLYRYYLKQDVERIIAEYNKRTPLPYVDDPSLSAAANASAKAVHQIKETALIQKRQDWVDKMKLRNAAWMETVKKIESAVRKRRVKNGLPNEVNRAARRELFTRRAKDEIPHVPTEFVEKTAAYKAATRIFRDGGTERGWQTLKPKIEKEWLDEEERKSENLEAAVESEAGGSMDVDSVTNEPLEVEAGNMRTNSNAGMPTRYGTQDNLLQMHRRHQQVQVQLRLNQQAFQQHRIQQRNHQASLLAAQNRNSFVARHLLQPQQQGQQNSLSVLAAAADLTNPSSYTGYGSTTSFQAQPSTHHTQMYSSMRFNSHSQTGSQSAFTQYPSINTSSMHQNPPIQEPARTGLTIHDLLAADPPNSKPAHFYPSY